MNQKVTLITTTYNQEKYIGECIESVQNQTHKKWEMIILDDGSTDGTVYTAEQYAKCDKRIKVYKFKHIGAGDLHNKYNFALGKASGDYIAVLEGEDTTESDRFERELWHFNYKDTVLVYGKAQRFGNDFNTVPTIRPDSLSEQTMLKEMFLGCHIPMLTVMMRKDILIKAGGFKSYGTLIGADYATWLSLLPYGEFIFLNAVLSKWRMHDGNLSKSQSNKIKEVFDCGYFWYKRMPKEFKKKVGMNDWQMYILNRYRMLKSFLIYYKNKGGR